MKIQNIIIHQICDRDKNYQMKFSEKELITGDDIIVDFMSKVITGFNHSKPNYGTFSPEPQHNVFQGYLLKSLENDAFLSMTKKSTEYLQELLMKSSNAKGGYILYCKYIQDNDDVFFITAMINETEKFKLENLNQGLEKLTLLEIDKLSRANRVNITKWKNYDSKQSLYLSFIRGKLGHSNFFYEFIGCTDKIATSMIAKELRNALDKYMTEHKYCHLDRISANTKIKQYIDKSIDDDQDLNIDTISAIINGHIPDDFSNFVITNNYQISSSFRLKKTDTKLFVRKVLKNKSIRLEFEIDTVNETVHREGNKVIITGFDEEELDNVFKQ